jgi:hypothetical protein
MSTFCLCSHGFRGQGLHGAKGHGVISALSIYTTAARRPSNKILRKCFEAEGIDSTTEEGGPLEVVEFFADPL